MIQVSLFTLVVAFVVLAIKLTFKMRELERRINELVEAGLIEHKIFKELVTRLELTERENKLKKNIISQVNKEIGQWKSNETEWYNP